MKYALVVFCFFLMGFKPNLEGSILVHKQVCEHYTKTQYLCFFIVKENKQYVVVTDRKGEYQIWQLQAPPRRLEARVGVDMVKT